jgi:5-(carboxyamino)imidazole ribonucleotide synthase
MLALAAAPLGVRCRFLDPAPDSPAGHVGELIPAPFSDESALARFAAQQDAITLEFENVPAAAVEFLARSAHVAPGARALRTAQDRGLEKALFEHLAIPTTRFRLPASEPQFIEAVRDLGVPCVAKTRRLGYDGKGQQIIRDPALASSAWRELNGGADAGGLIVEEFVPFEREVSIIAVRSRTGAIAHYPLCENTHAGGILRHTRAIPPGELDGLVRQARSAADAILAHLDYTGVLTIEFFAAGDRLIANEIAPRVHNSGHWTIEGAVCSQFENHVRAVLGLPLGDTSLRHRHAHMINLVGALPDLPAVAAFRSLFIHYYGKEPRAGRKVGHLTIATDNPNLVTTLLSGIADLPGISGLPTPPRT